MADDIAGLPDRLAYLEPVLRKFTLARPDSSVIENAQRHADSLDAASLAELAVAYREIVRRDDLHALSAWAEADADRFWREWEAWLELNHDREDRGQECLPDEQSPVRERGMQLFHMFDHLAKRKLPPFATRELVFSPPPVILDWTKLPEDLRYIREPVMKYADRWCPDSGAGRRVAGLTAEEREELKQLSARLRTTGDLQRLWAWERQFKATKHKEAFLLMILMEVLTDAAPW